MARKKATPKGKKKVLAKVKRWGAEELRDLWGALQAAQFALGADKTSYTYHKDHRLALLKKHADDIYAIVVEMELEKEEEGDVEGGKDNDIEL